MKTLLLATHNAHKVEEFRAILASLAKDTGKDYFYEDNDVERRFRKWNV